ncbi:hypothetical protein [Natronogracilivirga saccharolytica]|nr:hypothetical protein [Natronogracilivirga saccharolytica]
MQKGKTAQLDKSLLLQQIPALCWCPFRPEGIAPVGRTDADLL